MTKFLTKEEKALVLFAISFAIGSHSNTISRNVETNYEKVEKRSHCAKPIGSIFILKIECEQDYVSIGVENINERK